MLKRAQRHARAGTVGEELLMREGYDPSYGARPLKRAIQSLIQNPLAVKLLQGRDSAGSNRKSFGEWRHDGVQD